MRTSLLILALAIALFAGFKMWTRAKPQASAMVNAPNPATAAAAPATATSSKFETQVKPILQAQCKPCHFPGGAQYQRLPFDRPETIKQLGTKLFTRIHKEEDRRVIREFLSQP